MKRGAPSAAGGSPWEWRFAVADAADSEIGAPRLPPRAWATRNFRAKQDEADGGLRCANGVARSQSAASMGRAACSRGERAPVAIFRDPMQVRPGIRPQRSAMTPARPETGNHGCPEWIIRIGMSSGEPEAVYFHRVSRVNPRSSFAATGKIGAFFPVKPGSLPGDAVERLFPAQIELLFHQRRRGAEGIIEMVHGEHGVFQIVAENHRGPVTRGDVDAACRADG